MFNLFYNLQETLGEEVLRMGTDEITGRTRLLDNEIKVWLTCILSSKLCPCSKLCCFSALFGFLGFTTVLYFLDHEVRNHEDLT